MNYLEINRTPPAFHAIVSDTNALDYTMVSEPKMGALLAVLAASKPGGRLLELGTGTGHGTAWLLSGMDIRVRQTRLGVRVDGRRSKGSRLRFHPVLGHLSNERLP